MKASEKQRMISAVLLAIRRHARRVQNRKSHFDVNAHMEAIVALANIGLKGNRKAVASIGSNAKVRREDETTT